MRRQGTLLKTSYDYKVFRSANNARKEKAPELSRPSRRPPPGHPSCRRAPRPAAGTSCSSGFLLLVAAGFLTTVRYYWSHPPPTFRKESRRSTLKMHGLPESPGDRPLGHWHAAPTMRPASVLSATEECCLSHIHLPTSATRTYPTCDPSSYAREGTAIRPQRPSCRGTGAGLPQPLPPPPKRSHRCPPKMTTSQTLLHKDNPNTANPDN